MVSDKTCNFAPAFENKRAFSSVGLEHLPYKQRVGGSNPSTPTNRFTNQKHGWFPEWPNGADCKSAASSFGGSNPSPPTSTRDCFAAVSFFILFFYPLFLSFSFCTLYIGCPRGVLAKRRCSCCLPCSKIFDSRSVLAKRCSCCLPCSKILTRVAHCYLL